MPDAIRLVCPECDAVHRVKEITLGKLYRCKKCKSGLITMTPAVLACPSCGATTPPSHVEVSRLITCQECEDAPLMTVRFASSGRSSDTRLHRDTTRDLAKDLAKESAKESALLLEGPVTEESPAAESAGTPSEPAQRPQVASAAAAQEPPVASVAPVTPAKNTVATTEAGNSQPEDAPRPDSDFDAPPVETNRDSARLRQPRTGAGTTGGKEATPPAPPAARAGTPADGRAVFPSDAPSATGVGRPVTGQPEPDHRTSSRRFLRDRQSAEVRKVSAAAPDRRINDTAFITRRSEELLQHAEQTLESLQEEPLAENSPPLSPAPQKRAPERDEAGKLADDSFLVEPSRRNAPSLTMPDENGYPPEETDLPQLRQLLLDLQQPYLKELSRNRMSVPAWIPIAFALLLFGLFGWLVGEVDSLKAELSSARKQRQQFDDQLAKQSAEKDAERNQLQLMLQQEQNSKQAQAQFLLQLQNEKKRLESDLAELYGKYETLQKNSFTGLPGLPELDGKDR